MQFPSCSKYFAASLKCLVALRYEWSISTKFFSCCKEMLTSVILLSSLGNQGDEGEYYIDRDGKPKPKPPKTYRALMAVLAILIFLIELGVLIFAIKRAIDITRVGKDRVLHVLLAFLFPIPYLIISIIFGDAGARFGMGRCK